MSDAIVMALAEKRKEREGVAKHLERIDETIRRLQAAQEVDAGVDVAFPVIETHSGRPPILYVAQVIMREEGKPVHSEMVEKLAAERHGWKVRKGSVGSQLHRNIEKGHKVFFKVKDKPNTYGLVDYKAEPRDFRVRPDREK